MPSRALALLSLALAACLYAGEASAAAPQPWQLGFQDAATPVMETLNSVHNLLLWIISLISLFVLGLLAYTCVRFRASSNPTPSRRSHHTLLEIVWTGVPVLILVIIAVPSFKLLYYMDVVPEAEFTIKATGHQWYWTYEYPDHENITFDSYMVDEDALEPGQPRLLQTDNVVVLPTDTVVRVQITADDVLHSWAVPAFGVKLDAVPGRLNETWVEITEPGTYYGQCSELCGTLHGFMPITVQAVPPEEFAAWIETAKEQYASASDPDVAVVASRSR